MRDKKETHWIYDLKHGKGRVYIASNGSSLHFEVGARAAFMIWSPAETSVRAFRSIVELTLDPQTTGTGLLIRGFAQKLLEIGDWQKIWALLPSVPENEVQFVRFDFPTRGVAASPLIHGRIGRLGVAMTLRRDENLPGLYDIATLRQAFEATAHASIQGQFDWALETLTA